MWLKLCCLYYNSYLWVEGGYLGSGGLSEWVGESGRWVGQMGGQVRWVGTGYVRWLGGSSGSGRKVR